MKKQFKLDEIDCANCARELQDELAKLEGVKSVSVNRSEEHTSELQAP